MTTEGEKPPNNLVVLPGGSGAPEGDPEMMELFEEASVKLRKDMRGGGIRAFGMVVVLANEDVMAIHQAGQRWHQLVSGLDGVRFKLHLNSVHGGGDGD